MLGGVYAMHSTVAFVGLFAVYARAERSFAEHKVNLLYCSKGWVRSDLSVSMGYGGLSYIR